MTVIAFDGKTVAADRQACINGTTGQVTKIERVGRTVVGFSGYISQGILLLEWFKDGAKPDLFPRPINDSERANLWVFGRGIIHTFEQCPYPYVIEEPFWAGGCGKDLAMGAMAMGADARRAVEIASRYDANCGLGIDVLEILP